MRKMLFFILILFHFSTNAMHGEGETAFPTVAYEILFKEHADSRIASHKNAQIKTIQADLVQQYRAFGPPTTEQSLEILKKQSAVIAILKYWVSLNQTLAIPPA